MHNSLLLALWAFVAFVIFKLANIILYELRHSRNAKRLGCKQPNSMFLRDPLGIGNIRGLMEADRLRRIPDCILERTKAACEREGKIVSTFYFNTLGSPAVFTLEPKNIQTVLATHFKEFGLGDKRNNNFFPLLGAGIFSTDGEQWQHSRAMLRPQFVRDQVSDLDLEERHVQHMMRALPAGADGRTTIIDIMPLFFRLTLDSATEFLFGESVDSQLTSLPGYQSTRPPMAISEKEFAYSFDQAQAGLSRAARAGDFYYLLHTKEFKDHCKRCHDFIDHYVQLALNKQKPSSQTDTNGKQKYVFIDGLLENTRDPIEIRSHMLSILLAGRDTTASLLSFVFMLFTKHPDVYAKLRTIIREDFGTATHPREMTFSGLKSCNYLQWVLNETLRLYPVVPVDGRVALQDTTLPIGGGPDGMDPVYVRKGWRVDYSVYVMHRRKDLWGPDAEEFRPDRWDGRRSGFEYLPFNGGPRICIGQQFALTEAGYVIVRLLQRFESIEGVGNSWEPVEKGGVGYVKQNLTLTMCPADGVKVRFTEARE